MGAEDGGRQMTEGLLNEVKQGTFGGWVLAIRESREKGVDKLFQ